MNQVVSNNGQNCTAIEKCVCVCVYDLNQVVLVTFIIAKILEIQMSINRRMDRKNCHVHPQNITAKRINYYNAGK